MVVWQLGGVDVHIVVSVDALDDFPLNLVFRFLAGMHSKKKKKDEMRNCLMRLQRSRSTSDNGGCAVRRPTPLSYLHVLVEEQDEDETQGARH